MKPSLHSDTEALRENPVRGETDATQGNQLNGINAVSVDLRSVVSRSLNLKPYNPAQVSNYGHVPVMIPHEPGIQMSVEHLHRPSQPLQPTSNVPIADIGTGPTWQGRSNLKGAVRMMDVSTRTSEEMPTLIVQAEDPRRHHSARVRR